MRIRYRNIEAAVRALPVFSTRIPGCVDSVVEAVTGTLVPPRDAVALTEAMDLYCDDAGLKNGTGRQRVNACCAIFVLRRFGNKLYQEYLRLVQEKNSVSVPHAQGISTQGRV